MDYFLYFLVRFGILQALQVFFTAMLSLAVLLYILRRM